MTEKNYKYQLLKLTNYNNVKQICEFYEQNKNNMLKKEMYEKLHISKNTFKNYLKIGDKYGWCVYEPNKNKGNHNKISIFVDNGEKIGRAHV